MKKMIKAIVIIFIFAILLFPNVSHYKDGGTVTYDAILYGVRKEHSMAEPNGCNVGTKVRILFWEVYDDVKYIANK